MSLAPYSNFDPGGDGVTQSLLNNKQDALKVNGNPINTNVLDTFVIGGAEENNATNSLVTASALETWFEGIQSSFLSVLPGQNSGHRVGTIDSASPSTTNVPSCSAVVSHVNTKLAPINSNITSLQNNKVDQTSVVSSVTDTNLTSTNIITEGALLNYISGNPELTTNGVSIVNVQPRLYARSITETTDQNFNFIKSGVNDVTSGYDSTKDNRLATMACTHNHFIEQISENKFGINLNLIHCEFATHDPLYGWSVQSGDLPAGYGITALQQVAITSSGQIKVIRNQTTGGEIIYTPNKIQQVAIPPPNEWTENLPQNVNVIHADIVTARIFVLGSSASELEINWSIPIQTIVANDTWTGITYDLPTGLRVLAYNHVTKGICVLVRSSDTAVYNNNAISWFDLNLMAELLRNQATSTTFPTLNMSTTTLKNDSGLQSSPINGLGVLDASSSNYNPIFCSDVYVTGDSTYPGVPITTLLDDKIDKPTPTFLWPSGVSQTELGYLSNVTSDIQQQIDNVVPASFEPLRLGDSDPQSFQLHTLLYSSSFLPNSNQQSNSVLAVPGLGVANASGDAYRPIFCSELYTGGGDTSVGTTLTQKLAGKVNTSDVDSVPTLNSTNLVTSGGIYNSLDGKVNTSDVDTVPTLYSTNLVESGGVKSALDNIQYQIDNDVAPINDPEFTGIVFIPELEVNGDVTLNSTRANSFTTKTFKAFKTSAAEILVDTIPEPISCTAYTNAGALGEITASNANHYELLSPNGAKIHSHLTSNYVPIPATGGGANRSVIRNATNDGWTFSNGANLDVSYRTDDVTTALDFKVPSVLGLKNYAVPIPATGGGANRSVIRNATNDGWTFSDGANLDVSYRTDDVTTAQDWKIPSVLGLKNYAVPITTPSFSVSRTATGNYTITFTTEQPNANYVIMLTTETITTGSGVGTTNNLDDYMIAYYSKSAQSFGVYIKEQDDGGNDGIFRDCRWDFLCSYRGHIFCQGSINGFTGTAYPG